MLSLMFFTAVTDPLRQGELGEVNPMTCKLGADGSLRSKWNTIFHDAALSSHVLLPQVPVEG